MTFVCQSKQWYDLQFANCKFNKKCRIEQAIRDFLFLAKSTGGCEITEKIC